MPYAKSGRCPLPPTREPPASIPSSPKAARSPGGLAAFFYEQILLAPIEFRLVRSCASLHRFHGRVVWKTCVAMAVLMAMETAHGAAEAAAPVADQVGLLRLLGAGLLGALLVKVLTLLSPQAVVQVLERVGAPCVPGVSEVREGNREVLGAAQKAAPRWRKAALSDFDWPTLRASGTSVGPPLALRDGSPRPHTTNVAEVVAKVALLTTASRDIGGVHACRRAGGV